LQNNPSTNEKMPHLAKNIGIAHINIQIWSITSWKNKKYTKTVTNTGK